MITFIKLFKSIRPSFEVASDMKKWPPVLHSGVREKTPIVLSRGVRD